MDLEKLRAELQLVFEDLFNQFQQRNQPGDLIVLGCSTSEVVGERIGKASSPEVGQLIIEMFSKYCQALDMQFCVQGCEHINRSLVIEKAVALARGFEIVNVKPAYHAGGAASVAAYDYFQEAVMVEHVVAQAGVDIGDTFIGMHVKHVQVPLRPQIKSIGGAHVTALTSRPKYIGGPRAAY